MYANLKVTADGETYSAYRVTTDGDITSIAVDLNDDGGSEPVPGPVIVTDSPVEVTADF